MNPTAKVTRYGSSHAAQRVHTSPAPNKPQRNVVIHQDTVATHVKPLQDYDPQETYPHLVNGDQRQHIMNRTDSNGEVFQLINGSTKKSMLSSGVRSPTNNDIKIAEFQHQHNSNKLKRRNQVFSKRGYNVDFTFQQSQPTANQNQQTSQALNSRSHDDYDST